MYITDMEGICEYRRQLKENLMPFYFSKESSCDPTFNIINTTKISKSLELLQQRSKQLQIIRETKDVFKPAHSLGKAENWQATSEQLLIIFEPAEDGHENKNKPKKSPETNR